MCSLIDDTPCMQPRPGVRRRATEPHRTLPVARLLFAREAIASARMDRDDDEGTVALYEPENRS